MTDGLLSLSGSWQEPRLFPLGSSTVAVRSCTISRLTCFSFLFFNSQLKATFVGKLCVLVKFLCLLKKWVTASWRFEGCLQHLKKV